MTEKQKKILSTALELFSREGYNGTSTKKIAKEAGVSEALIFRHFENKRGLLESILEQGESRVRDLYAEIVLEQDPKKVIAKVLELPFTVPKEAYDFWRLQFKMKWEIEYDHDAKMAPLQIALRYAFEKLGYEEPEVEAEFVMYFLDGISSATLKGALFNPKRMEAFVLAKYKL